MNVSASGQLAKQYQVRQWPTRCDYHTRRPRTVPGGKPAGSDAVSFAARRRRRQIEGTESGGRVGCRAAVAFTTAEGTQSGTRDPLHVAPNETELDYGSQSRSRAARRTTAVGAGDGFAGAPETVAAAGTNDLPGQPDATPASANAEAGPTIQNGAYLGAKSVDSYRSRWERSGEPAIPALPARELLWTPAVPVPLRRIPMLQPRIQDRDFAPSDGRRIEGTDRQPACEPVCTSSRGCWAPPTSSRRPPCPRATPRGHPGTRSGRVTQPCADAAPATARGRNESAAGTGRLLPGDVGGAEPDGQRGPAIRCPTSGAEPTSSPMRPPAKSSLPILIVTARCSPATILCSCSIPKNGFLVITSTDCVSAPASFCSQRADAATVLERAGTLAAGE